MIYSSSKEEFRTMFRFDHSLFTLGRYNMDLQSFLYDISISDDYIMGIGLETVCEYRYSTGERIVGIFDNSNGEMSVQLISMLLDYDLLDNLTYKDGSSVSFSSIVIRFDGFLNLITPNIEIYDNEVLTGRNIDNIEEGSAMFDMMLRLKQGTNKRDEKLDSYVTKWLYDASKNPELMNQLTIHYSPHIDLSRRILGIVLLRNVTTTIDTNIDDDLFVSKAKNVRLNKVKGVKKYLSDGLMNLALRNCTLDFDPSIYGDKISIIETLETENTEDTKDTGETDSLSCPYSGMKGVCPFNK